MQYLREILSKIQLFKLNKKWSRNIGTALVTASISLLVLIFYPVIYKEFWYQVDKPEEDITVELADRPDLMTKSGSKTSRYFIHPEFGITIPKIAANAMVISDVDAFDVDDYTKALEKGVAHANGTSYPGQRGNTFLFAHSAVNFYEANRQNVHFYLLNKLENGDDIYASYKGKLVHYKVVEKSIVGSNELKYLTEYREYNTLTLMTCWPAGTDWKRVMVVAREVVPSSETNSENLRK